MNITTLLNDLSSVIHGTNITKVPNIYGIINRGARALLLDIDPKESTRIVSLGQVFNDTYDYAIPADVKGDRIIDIRPQAGRKPADIFVQDYGQTFDANKSTSFSNAIFTQWNTGVKTLRIEAPTLTAPVSICDTSTITGWTATSGASNIALDTTNYVAGGGAISFDLDTITTTASIQISSLNQVDLSSYEDVATNFYWVYLPDASGITSLNIRWGSDITANYYSYTSTATQQGTAFQDGWNLIEAPWASATVTGSPDSTLIDSVKLSIVYDGVAQTGLKFCSLTSTLGYYYQIVYYSKYLFRNASTNAFQESITDSTEDSRLINLDTESYNLLFNKCAFFVAQALQGADASYDATFWDSEYKTALAKYKALNPSEAMKKGEVYYKMPRKSYRGYGNGNFRN